MRIPRFFVNAEAIDASSQTVSIDDASQVRQIVGVLRLGRGDKIDVLDGAGTVYRVCLGEIGKKAVSGTIEATHNAKADTVFTVSVAVPLLKGERFEWAIEKLTELGVDRIVPLVCHRTVVRPSDNGGEKDESPRMKRWCAIAKEASQQSERATIPHIVTPISLDDLLKGREVAIGISGDGSLLGSGSTFLLQERSSAPTLASLLSDRASKLSRDILVITGPEGGFTEQEIESATKQGVTAVSLGKQILRSETAALCAAALIITFLTKDD